MEIILIEMCLIRDVDLHDFEAEFVDPQNVDFVFLNQFLDHNGIDILIDIKEKYSNNRIIYDLISRFEQKFFNLDSNEGLEMIHSSSNGNSANQGMDQNDSQIYLKSTGF